MKGLASETFRRTLSVGVAAVLLAQVLACSSVTPPTPSPQSVAPSPTPTSAPPTVAPTSTVPPTATTAPLPTATNTAVSTKEAVGGLEAGVQVFLWGNAPTTERDLGLVKEAGFTWVKDRFEWRYIEPHVKGEYEWGEADRIVDAVESAGLKLLIRVDNQPVWTRADDVFPGSGPPDKMSDFTDFIGDMAARYKGRIAAYEIWNEPNLAREWGNQRPNAAEYVEMLKASYKAIKAADPDAIVISAGLAPTTASGDVAVPDIEFLQQMYEAGAKGSFDLLGVHAAGYAAPPEASPDEVAANDAYNHGEGDAGRVYAFRHAEEVRKVMLDNGDAKTKMAIVEFGWTTDDREDSPYFWHSVTEDQQADYLVRAFKYARQNWASDVALMSLIYIAEPNWTPEHEQYYWSITYPDGTARPAYLALSKALRE